MPSTNAVYGPAVKLGVGANPPTAGQRVQFKDCSLQMKEEKKDMNAMRGDLSRSANIVRPNIRRVGGMLSVEPTAVELEMYLPWILGTAVAGTTYALSNVVIPQAVTVARDNSSFGGTDGKVFIYPVVGVDEADITGSKANALEFNLNLLGIDESAPAAEGTFPALTIDLTTKPFLFVDSASAFTFNSVVYPVDNFALKIRNVLDRERFYNSPILLGLFKTDRIIEVTFDLPWAGSEVLYGAGSAGVPLVVVFANGGSILTFNFASVEFMRETPTGRGRDEHHLRITGQAYRTSGALELITTLAPGP